MNLCLPTESIKNKLTTKNKLEMKNKTLLPVLFFAVFTFQTNAQQKIIGSASGSTQTVIASPHI